MIGVLAAMLMQGATVPAAPAERWEPWMAWSCMMREGKATPYSLAGVIAQRNEPDQPIPYMRHERALRILIDGSGRLSGRQARSPLFIERPGEFWATFADDQNGLPGTLRMLVLKIADTGGRGTGEISAGEAHGSKRYASGPCLARLIEKKAGS